MAQINPYIHFNGNAEDAFTFYKSIFGGEFAMVSRFKDFSNPEHPISERDANRIMHIALPIANSPWGSYFGMFRDKYGIEWMVDFDPIRNG
ncbi:MAG: hypothetical protein WCK09_13850 [Bacteroidota bacterium]